MKRVGEKLVELIQAMGGKVPETKLSEGELTNIRNYLLSRSRNSMICEDLWTFLTDILTGQRQVRPWIRRKPFVVNGLR